jgi:hypothetical protein
VSRLIEEFLAIRVRTGLERRRAVNFAGGIRLGRAESGCRRRATDPERLVGRLGDADLPQPSGAGQREERSNRV